MAELTGALYEYEWFPDSIDFFEGFLAKNAHWHIKECEDKDKKEFLKEEYLVNTIWQSYPLLGPSLAASIANFFGYWNEVFPKIFNIKFRYQQGPNLFF